jgi:hypothetical protein
MIPIQGKDIVTKANVPAGKAATADFGVIDVTMKIAKPTGDTSKASPSMPSYKTIPGRKQGSKLQRKLKTVNVGESTMKTTFKQFLAESADDAVFKVAADFLDTTPANLESVPKSVEDEVLDKGKEIKHDFIKAAIGKWVVRLFTALNKKFARVEAPTGKVAMYRAAETK